MYIAAVIVTVMTMDTKKMLYLGGNKLYLVGWAITFIGLSLVQDECADVVTPVHVTRIGITPVRSIGVGEIPFFTGPVGEDCRKGFRFFWFVWALGSIPPLLAVIASCKPGLARGVSTSYFAVIAPLNILMANSFLDASDIATGAMQDHMKLATAGFCILSAAALLMLLMDSLLAGEPAKSATVPHSGAAKGPPAEAV